MTIVERVIQYAAFAHAETKRKGKDRLHRRHHRAYPPHLQLQGRGIKNGRFALCFRANLFAQIYTIPRNQNGIRFRSSHIKRGVRDNLLLH